jgi:hypothetical protein
MNGLRARRSSEPAELGIVDELADLAKTETRRTAEIVAERLSVPGERLA